MNNREFFEYLNLLGKLPYISHQEWYRLLLDNKINIKDYYLVYSKIQPGIEYNDGMNRMIESVSLLLEVIDNQEDFDKFTRGLNDIIKMYYTYSNAHKFIESVELSYIGILRELAEEFKDIDTLLKAMRIIVNPDKVLVDSRMFFCDCKDFSPKSHFRLYTGNGEEIDNVAMITYKNGVSKIHHTRSYGDYKKCILKLREMLKNNSIDFAVCSHILKYGEVAPLYRVLLTDCEIV